MSCAFSGLLFSRGHLLYIGPSIEIHYLRTKSKGTQFIADLDGRLAVKEVISVFLLETAKFWSAVHPEGYECFIPVANY